jgi:hypothetical protein
MTDDAATPAADSTHPDEILRFWEVARVRAGVMRVAAVTGPGIAGSGGAPSRGARVGGDAWSHTPNRDDGTA